MNGEQPREQSDQEQQLQVEIRLQQEPLKEPEKVLELTGPVLESKQKEKTEEQLLKEENYHFEIFERMEPVVISLVDQLKDNIDNGEYSAILSDETGGRFVSLVLDRVGKVKSPQKIKTYFVSSGEFIFPRKESKHYTKFKEYLKSLDLGKKVLIATQFISTGRTVLSMQELLNDIGVESDVATLSNSGESVYTERIKNVYVGKVEGQNLFQPPNILTGISKPEITDGPDISPLPTSLIERSKSGWRDQPRKEVDKQKIWESIFGNLSIKDVYKERKRLRAEVYKDPSQWDLAREILEIEKKYDKYVEKIKEERNKPYTEEEIKIIRENIGKARQDIKVMAERVIDQVWGDQETKKSTQNPLDIELGEEK